MNSVFNTPFEVSLRLILLLSCCTKPQTIDSMLAIDFISIYAKDFGLSEHNLHGDNIYMYSEIAARRSATSHAMKLLVRQGMIDVLGTSDGFRYSISLLGSEYCSGLQSEYAIAYRASATTTLEYANQKSDRELLVLIGKQSVLSVRSGRL